MFKRTQTNAKTQKHTHKFSHSFFTLSISTALPLTSDADLFAEEQLMRELSDLQEVINEVVMLENTLRMYLSYDFDSNLNFQLHIK